ncbi:MAG: hypothetical protein ASARMPRED_004421 [Alectoria sarmentosa]|nr:MAG: hypothetical protein ASARMPRED_004421 [Alectoria sarmentosa]
MPAPSPDQEQSQTPSHPPAEEQEDAAVDESSPFLPSDSLPAIPSFRKPIHIFTALALTFSILALVSLFVTAVARQAGPVSFNLPWSTKEGLNGILAPAIFSLLFSAYSLRRVHSNKSAAPLALNLIVDIVIAFFAITYGAGGLSGLLDGQGGWCSYPGGDYSICRRGALPVKVFAGIAMGAGIAFGVMHFVLFCVRGRITYSSGLGRSPWRLPVGQLKFEVSIKFLRELER